MRIVLACGGGSESSLGVPWLQERYRAEVIAVTVDLGQGRELEAVRDRALASGARRAHVIDGRETFASEHVLRAIRADASQDGDPMPKPLGRPVLARALVDIAGLERADAVAHGCRDPLDRTRLETAVRALNPDLPIKALAAECGQAATAMSESQRHPPSLPSFGDELFTTDVNLWGRSFVRRKGAPGLAAERALHADESGERMPQAPQDPLHHCRAPTGQMMITDPSDQTHDAPWWRHEFQAMAHLKK